MSKSHRIIAAFVTFCATIAMLAAGSAQALAGPVQPVEHGELPAQSPIQSPVTIDHVTNGSPIWVFVVVAVAAAVVSATAALVAVLVRQARRSTVHA